MIGKMMEGMVVLSVFIFAARAVVGAVEWHRKGWWYGAIVALGGVISVPLLYVLSRMHRGLEISRGSIVHAVGIFLVFMIVMGNAGVVPFILLYYGLMLSEVDIGLLASMLMDPYTLAMGILIPGTLLFLGLIRYGRGMGDMILFRREGRMAALVVAVLIAIALALLFFAGDILARTELRGLVPEGLRRLEGLAGPGRADIIQWSPLGTAVFFIAGSVFAPIFEESFFRGYLFDVVGLKSGRVWAYIVVSLFFALAHLSVLNFAGIFVASIVLCWTYERYGLVPAIALHGFYNAITVLLYILIPLG